MVTNLMSSRRTNDVNTALKTVLDIPIIVAGVCHYPTQRAEVHEVRYENGMVIRVPTLTRDDIKTIESTRTEAGARLGTLTNQELTGFLQEVGNHWLSEQSAGRQLVRSHAATFTGLPADMIEVDCWSIGAFMAGRAFIYDAIASEFGSERFFDEWHPVQMCFRRAFPRGLALHYLVGNIPLASLYSLLRGIITRNMNLVKWATRDPITPLGFVQAFLEVDPSHPVSRSLSVAYWPHQALIEEACLRIADTVCVWGSGEAVEAIKRKVGPGIPISEYGPRRTAAVVDLEACDVDRAAYRLVEDVAFYDQEACLSCQRAFVRGDVDDFVEKLGDCFELFSQHYPISAFSRDVSAHRSLSLLEAKYMGWKVKMGCDWAVVVAKEPQALTAHPLCRTLYIHPIQEVGEVARYLDRRTQTLSVYPWSLTQTFRDTWARCGVDRLVDLGGARMPRPGLTHDGTFGLHPFVRIVCVERELTDHSKYWTSNDHDEWERLRFRGPEHVSRGSKL